MNYEPVRFPREKRDELLYALRSNVKQYFDSQGLQIYGGSRMVVKTAVMLGIYFLPFLAMLTGVADATWSMWLCWLLMGIGMAGIGMGVMHDANHGSYSAHPEVNRWVGFLMINLTGGLAFNWKIQHNKLHHSSTNIEGHDEDIAPPFVLRFSPHDRRHGIHRFQHWYAWFFYGLMTLVWITVKDFRQLFDYRRRGLLGRRAKDFPKLLIQTILIKVFYYAYVLALPLWLIDLPVWQVVVGFLAMHFVSGLIMGSIFQLAHVMPTSEYPLPDENNQVEHQWAAHQLRTTHNFAAKHPWLYWYAGGLTHQVEHHLFPNISHVHYRQIAPIVQRTAEQFGVPYHSFSGLSEALKQHVRMLHTLGTQDDWVPAASSRSQGAQEPA